MLRIKNIYKKFKKKKKKKIDCKAILNQQFTVFKWWFPFINVTDRQ